MPLSEAARLLGCSRPTVEQRVKDGRLQQVEGSSPAQVELVSLLAEIRKQMARLTHELSRLQEAHDFLATDLRGAEGEASGVAGGITGVLQPLRDELTRERTGRALAETRIDQLKQDLRRANAAIGALTVDPDSGLG